MRKTIRKCTVLGSARTGLISTGIQEGEQPGGLTPPGQTEHGIPYHVPSCWVPVGGSRAVGTHSQLGNSQRRSWRAALWVVRFVLCFLLLCIVVVPVPFVFCSVKLPLSRPTSFCLVLSILLRTPAGGGAAAWRFCCWPQPNHNMYLTDKTNNMVYLDIYKANITKHDICIFYLLILKTIFNML